MTARILIVEDHPLNLRLVIDILEYRGHVIASAVNVSEARTRLMSEKPDLVLLDLHIPGGDGETLLHEIRGNILLVDLPVIAVTAFAMGGDRERLLREGFDGYISKPINVRTFAAEVESFLARDGPRALD